MAEGDKGGQSAAGKFAFHLAAFAVYADAPGISYA